MGKVPKKALEKHSVSLSPALANFIQQACSLPLADLPSHLDSLPTRWPFPRGDLYNWIEVLDRFDGVLQRFNDLYKLSEGHQARSFGLELLVEQPASNSEQELRVKGYEGDGDRELVEAILCFSRLLLEKCGNRALYSSTDRLNHLLNTTSLSLLNCTLRITIFLAQRYAERSTNPSQPHASFYQFDQSKLDRLATSFASPSSPLGKSGPTSPVKTSKGKEKPTQSSKRRRSSVSVSPNDFRSMVKTTSTTGDWGKQTGSAQDPDWQPWARVRVVWTAPPEEPSTRGEEEQPDHDSEAPPTPTPLRRQSSALARPPLLASAGDTTTAIVPPALPEKSGVRSIELSATDLAQSTAEQILNRTAPEMPQPSRYELLHKVRVAYGLVESLTSRRLLLQIRLLALAIVAYIYDEHEFSLKLFGSDVSHFTRQQLIHQIVSLLQENKKNQENITIYLQTLAMESLAVLARQRMLAGEITSALAPNSGHGLLLTLTQRGLADMAHDGDDTDTPIGDDWREAIFSLCSAFMIPSLHSRSSENMIHPTLITAYATGLKIMSGKALRVHLRILDFMKSFFHYFKDGLAVLSANHVFEAACDLLNSLSQSALELFNNGEGIRKEYKTKVTDYQIPYMHQQAIRSMIDLVNDIIIHQGGHAERILRNLVDSQSLLAAFRSVLSNIEAFGAHTWSEVVKAIVGFLHNEPTSYTIISEANIIVTLLSMVSSSSGPTQPDTIRPVAGVSNHKPLAIPAVADAIVNLSQAFGAVCLTSAGFDYFESSGALERFFEIFQSPAHVKVIKDANTLAHLGSTFDEFVRHHPSLKDAVLSNVITMVARVRYICQSRAWEIGAGPKLWLNKEPVESIVAGGEAALTLEIVPKAPDERSRYQPLRLPDGTNLDVNGPPMHAGTDITSSAKDIDADGLSVVDYARPAVCFLANFFENQGLCLAFMEAGAYDLVLDLATMPSLPPSEQTFGGVNAVANQLTGLIHMMAEVKPHLVLPAIVDRAKFACESLRNFSDPQADSSGCFFEQFVRQRDADATMDIESTESTFRTAGDGTKHVKALTTTLILVQILAELFNSHIYNTRNSTNTLFHQVNVADMLADLCRSLGLLSSACYREEIAIQRVMPERWLRGTRPGDFTTGHDDMDKILHLTDSSVPGAEESVQDHSAPKTDEAQESLKQDQQLPEYKNAQTLRYLLIEMPNQIMEFFARLGRGIAGKRRAETFAKQKTALVAEALADAYIAQLQPQFLSAGVPEDDEMRKQRFDYLSVALSNVRGSLSDDSQTMGPSTSRQAFVINAFRRKEGLKILTRIGTEFFDQLASCKYSRSVFSANAGLKICLDILDDFTNGKHIVEGNQAASMRNTEPSRPFYFNSSQLLLELRMEALALTRLIWDSDYADQASNDVVLKLISILDHVFLGDHENDAAKADEHYPQIQPHNKRRYIVDVQKLSALTSKGYSQDLARESLYRCNVGHSSHVLPTTAEEYCKSIQNNSHRRRLPIPADETDSAPTSGAAVLRSPASGAFADPPTMASFLTGESTINATLAEVVSSMTDNDADDMDDDDEDEDDLDDTTGPSGRNDNNTSAMNLSNILNHSSNNSGTVDSAHMVSKPLYSVTTIDAERESIRDKLPERCNNIVNSHPNLTWELRDLMISASKKLTEDGKSTFWKLTSELWLTSLVSMQTEDDMTEVVGKRIAAATHLIALYIQDNEVFLTTVEAFKENFDNLLSFLRVPPIAGQASNENSAPWIAPILAIFERMLSFDAEPPSVTWNMPADMETANEATLKYHDVLSLDQRKALFSAITDILPRVGKTKSTALSVVRTLAILTRNREIAGLQGQRGSLQRLFLMVKQLGSAAQGLIQSSFILIIRHIIEDEAVLQQIMQSEIKATLNARGTARQMDLASFMRDKYHLALRSSEIFTEVANDTIKFATYSPHAGNPGLVLKNPEIEKQDESNKDSDPTDGITDPAPAASIEGQHSEDVSKSVEVKAPVVEHHDGVIHFLLCELLAYKDVEDKEPVVPKDHQPATEDRPLDPTLQDPSPIVNGVYDYHRQNIHTQEKMKFKTDDHPIFLYRCFLLQTLTELLYCYNRTKIEFINFSRKSDPMAATPSKPRSGVLNYILNALASSGYVDKDNTVACKKKMIISEWAVKVVVALCTKTGEAGLDGLSQRFSSHSHINDQDSEPDLAFIRRFTLEHIIKAFKDATASTEPLQLHYSRLLCLGDLFNKLLTKPMGPEGFAGLHNNSYKVLGRMMFEKNLIAVLTSSLADIDLSFPSAKKVIKFILRPLQELTSLAVQLSINSPEVITSAIGNDTADTISSASSVSDLDDHRESTPDLFRNSALGIISGDQQHEPDTSEDDEEEGEEMYDDEYADEMDYDEGAPGPNDGEVVSDDDIDEEIDEHGEGADPMEGLPGDHPMDIEFVVNDELSLEDDSDEDEDESDDDDEDLGDDFEMGDDDQDSDGDEEDESLGEDNDEGDGWEDDDDDDGDDNEEPEIDLTAAFDGEELPAPIEMNIPRGAHEVLENLIRENGGLERHADGLLGTGIPQMILQSANSEDHDDPDEEEDEGDEMNEDDGIEYDDGFNAMLGGPDDLDEDGHWGWDEQPYAMYRRHRQHAGFARGHLPLPGSRRYPNLDSGYHHLLSSRHHRHAPPARSGADDGTNPLLQRPERSRGSRMRMPFNVTVMSDTPPGVGGMRGNMISMHIPAGGMQADSAGFENMPGHGSVLDAMLNIFGGGNRGGLGQPAIPPEGIRFSLSGPNDFRDLMMRSLGAIPGQVHGRALREDTNRIPSFVPLTTAARWQEETRNLFGNTYVDKIQLVQKHVMSKLVPLAQEEEKARRVKKTEEDERRKELEELGKLRAEEERVRKLEEQEKAALQAAAQAAAAAEREAELAAANEASADAAVLSDTDPMEGVQTDVTHTATDDTSFATAPSEPQRIYTTIRGRRLDITGLNIDLEYLEAIPEELREEVIMAQYTSRRGEAVAQETEGTTNDASTIDPDFLNALPEEIREEIRQQEQHLARRRERELARQQRAAGAAQAEDMDNDNFLATLEPALRRAILAEQPPEVLSTLDPRHAAEGRAHHRGIFYRRPGDHDLRDDRARRIVSQKDRRQVVQLIDRAGVATLLRLMFLPQQGSLRQHLWQILGNICGNRQTRWELFNLLIQILKEGSTDVGAVERSLATLNIRAKTPASQKTPQPLKRTLSLPASAGLSEEITPMIVVQQCLSSLEALCKLGLHTRMIFLREQETGTTKVGKKGKGKENKAAKFLINDLLSLLDRRLILDSSASLSALSTVLDDVTSPLKILMQSREKALAAQKAAESAQLADPASTQSTGQDDHMTEAPASGPANNETTAEPSASQSQAPEQAPEQASTNAADDEANKEGELNKKPFEPPVISEHNLRLITSIFIAPECNADTFGKTVTTLTSLSHIPGTSGIFSKELINHVSVLSQAISADLDELLPLIREAQSTTDLQGITAAKFSASSSDQVKFLRVLTALDRFTAPKKDDDTGTKAKSVLNDTYETLSLGSLWHKLSTCLTAVREKGDTIGFANILLPLIESLMVVCKNTPLRDAPVAAESQDAAIRSPVLSSTNDLEDLFFNFTTEHRKILNDVVRQNPKLMQGDGSFALLVKNSKVLDFDNKRNFFTKQIHSRNHQRSHVQPPLQLSVRRNNVFLESYKGLYYKSAEEMKHGKLNIRFVGEEGVDAGGVTREWFQVLARSMFDANYALFQPVASDRTTFHPSPLSAVNDEHLQYFKFIGRIIGKALHEGRVLDCHFSRAVYKRILGKSPNLKDLESNDIDYYKSLVWILENDITDILTEEFCVIEDEFGEQKTVDLIPNGRNIPVTQENKREYVQKLVEYRLTESVKDQLDWFLMGFHDIIPAELVAIFNEQELELLISGLPEVDVDDWKANTEYHNYSPASPQIVWFWRIVRGMTNEERAKLLQFITGTSKVPLNGFKELEGVSGLTRFNIHKDPSTNRLPSSHTCFNQLDLPTYDSFEVMKQQLMTAINLGADYFGFA